MRGTRWFHGGGNLPSIQVGVSSLCGEEGAVETAALLRRVHYAKFWRPTGSAMSFSRCNGGARSWAGSRRISSIMSFLIAMLATSARSWPMLSFRISASSLSCHMAVVRGTSVVCRISRCIREQYKAQTPACIWPTIDGAIGLLTVRGLPGPLLLSKSCLRKLMPNLEHVTWREPKVTPSDLAISSREIPSATQSLIF